MSNYGLQIRNNRLNTLINVASYAKVFHQYSGRADGGNWQEVPTMTTLLAPHVNAGNGQGVSYSGVLFGHAKPASDFGLASTERVWHAVTPIFHGDISQLEGDANGLESCVPTMCIYNREDHHFYTSRSAVQKRSEIPAHVTMGVVYE